MIASRIGVIVAAAIALVLAVIVIVDRPSPAPSRALARDLDTLQLSRLAWTRAGEPEIVLERVAGKWSWMSPVAGIEADAGTVNATIAALRGARWHRKAPIAQAGPLHVALHATGASGPQIKIGIGKPLAGAGQTWVAIGDSAYLVDDWVARALAPAPLALRDTRPLRDAASAKTIVIDRVTPTKFAVRIEGARLVRPIDLRIHPNHLAQLHAALAKLTIQAIPTKIDPTIIMTVSIDTPKLVTLEIRAAGECTKDTLAVSGTFGHACITFADFRAIEVAMDLFRAPSIALADQMPARVDPVRITLPDGGVLDLEKRPRIGDHDADPAAVAELLLVLQTSVDAIERDPASPVQSKLVVTSRAGETIELELLPDKHIRRKGEPIALGASDAAWRILTRSSSALRDPTPWTEDELTIQSITIDKTTYTRGAVVGEWSGGGIGLAASHGAALTALARALAKPRLPDAPRPPGKTVALSFTTAPPSGAPVTRTMQVAKNCLAVVDGRNVLMQPALCDAVGKVLP